MSFTPGPWKDNSLQDWARKTGRGPDEMHLACAVWNEECDKFICTTRHAPGKSQDVSPEEQHDNARLIAAAPDLLTAAQAMLAKLENLTTEQFERGGEKAEREMLAAAIAKATT